ncbi:hypothetical protein SGPA1_30897 [Streptomyces misionensis JCM 4497]
MAHPERRRTRGHVLLGVPAAGLHRLRRLRCRPAPGPAYGGPGRGRRGAGPDSRLTAAPVRHPSHLGTGCRTARSARPPAHLLSHPRRTLYGCYRGSIRRKRVRECGVAGGRALDLYRGGRVRAAGRVPAGAAERCARHHGGHRGGRGLGRGDRPGPARRAGHPGPHTLRRHRLAPRRPGGLPAGLAGRGAPRPGDSPLPAADHRAGASR